MSVTSKIFLIIQWALLVIVLIYAAFKDKRIIKSKKELVELHISKIAKGSETDLDVLYKLLKEKKQISIATIATAFKVKEKLVMEWAKILESGNLAIIDYPRIGGPVLKKKLTKEELMIEEENKKGKKNKGDKKGTKIITKNKKKKGDKEGAKPLANEIKKGEIKQKKQLDEKNKEKNKEKQKVEPEKLDKKSRKNIKKFSKQTQKVEKKLKRKIKKQPKKKESNKEKK